MTSRAPVMRLFAGVYPPIERAREMLGTLGQLDLPRHRVTPVEQVHMTLHFLGDRHERELEGIIESLERSAAGIGAFELLPSRLATLPERGEARLVALETQASPEVLEMHRRMVQRLADERHRGKERFVPHFTLCRFADPTRMERLAAPVEMAPVPVGSVRLMKSVLRPGGAAHALMHEVVLADQ